MYKRQPYPSVGATENLMMAALAGSGDTIIENCAIEPEIEDLQGFLRTCGFQIYGAGTDTIFIKGARGSCLYERPRDVSYFILEDRIAVSYTHLDVYKRQVLVKASRGMELEEIVEEILKDKK